MSFLPLRSRALPDGETIFVNDSGRFFLGSDGFVGRMVDGAETEGDRISLRAGGHLIEDADSLAFAAHSRAVARRIAPAAPLDYLILVPTLRCNLDCSYCQVSRVNIDRAGFDWSEETLEAVLETIDGLTCDRLKIEFQGGEPTLRPDLLRAVMEKAERFAQRQFVICSNLQHIDDELLAIFDRPDVFISTSLDGDEVTHGRHRTKDAGTTSAFFRNLRLIVDRYGPSKVSALPTINAATPPAADDLIDAYVAYGMGSIFLRPINYQGFARKRHKQAREQDETWRGYYKGFIHRLVERNWADQDRVLEETYFSIGLRRIFQPGRERHVDLRNPNPMGHDYIVVDHDGAVYPTDEARMLARSGVIDLSIGTIETGWDSESRDLLNSHATNQFDPACMQCAYQPYCGRDPIDDLARYGRIDMPRYDTAFCRRHMHLFDLIFRLLYTDCEKVRYSLAQWLRLPSIPDSFGEVMA